MGKFEAVVCTLCAVWLVGLIAMGVNGARDQAVFKAVCKDRGGVVMTYEGDSICMPEAVLEVQSKI